MKYSGNKNRNLRYSLLACVALLDRAVGFSLLAHPSLQSRIIHKRNTFSSLYLYPSSRKRKSDTDQSKGNPQIANGETVQPSTNLSQSNTDLNPSYGIVFDYNNNAQNNEEINKLMDMDESMQIKEDISLQEGGLSKVVYSACLITANTVGAGILLLPNAIASSGVLIPLAIFIGIYFLNIITSFYLSDLSIQQYEEGRPASMVPTSFKDIADESFGTAAGYALATLSVLFNYCILIFGMIRFGDTLSDVLSGFAMNQEFNPSYLSIGYASVLTVTIASLTNVALSKFSSVFVAVLFTSFIGLVIPGIQDSEWSTFVSNSGGYLHGTTFSEIVTSFVIAGPIITYVMEIQKIVPSVTKLCNFDRKLSRSAIVTGNSLPLVMYLSYIFISLGGNSVMTENNSLFLAFTFASIFGSSIASSMSLSEEFESFITMFSNPNSEVSTPLLGTSEKEDTKDDYQVNYSTGAVLLSIIPPLLIGLQLSSGGDKESVAASLDFAGGYLTPLFIWLFPAAIAWKKLQDDKPFDEKNGLTSIFDNVCIGIAFASTAVVITLELLKDFGEDLIQQI